MADSIDDMFTGGMEELPAEEESTFFSGEEPPADIPVTSEQGDVIISGPDGQEAEGEAQAYTLSVSDYGSLMVSSVPVGALLGAIFMIIGLAVLGIVKIFKKI